MRQLIKEKENSEFKPAKLRLKIDLVSYPARAEGLVNRTMGKLENLSILIMKRKIASEWKILLLLGTCTFLKKTNL